MIKQHYRTLGSRAFDGLNVSFMIFVALVTILPLWNVLMMSLVSVGEYFSKTIVLWPDKFYWDSYKYIFGSNEIPQALFITVLTTIVGGVYSLMMTTALAYGLSKKYLPGRNFFLVIITITMFFGGGLIPYFLLIKSLGLMNHLAAIILPAGVTTWYFLVMKSFFSQIPAELEESAMIDGASEITVFVRIVLPISTPVLATFFLFYAVGYWNQWYQSILFIQKQNLRPLQVVLREMIMSNTRTTSMQIGAFEKGVESAGMFDEGVKMATVIVATVPILCVYPFLQKYFAKGVMLGSIKG